MYLVANLQLFFEYTSKTIKNMTQKVLGLDLGTNSIGSSVRNLDLSDDLKGQLEFFSSDIFRSSVNKESNGREYSLAAQRSAHSRSRGLNEARRR